MTEPTPYLTPEELEMRWRVNHTNSMSYRRDIPKLLDSLAAARRELAGIRSIQRSIYAIATQFEGAPDEFRCWCRTCCAARLPENAPAPPQANGQETAE